MARYSIEDTTLTALGNAVRKHVGETAVKPYATDIIQVSVANAVSQYTYKYLPKNYHTGNTMKYHHVKVKITTDSPEEDQFTYEYRDGYSYFPFTLNENKEAVLYTDSRKGWVNIYIYGTNYASSYFNVTFEFTPYNEDGSIIGMEKVQTNTMTPLAMVDAINTIAPPFEQEDLTFSGDCKYLFCYSAWTNFINKFANSIKCENVDSAANMFHYYEGESIPFEINFSGSNNTVSKMFYYSKIREIPKINYCKPIETSGLFSACRWLRYLPEDIDTWFDWSYIDNPNITQGSASNTSGSRAELFYYCYSLRSVPMDFLNHGNVRAGSSYSIYYNLFNNCYALDEVVGLPIPHKHHQYPFTSNYFYNTFSNCSRVKNITFALQEDGSPYVCRWKGQTIDLTKIGYGTSSNILNYNSGIALNKEMKSAETYQALKDDPDSWTTNAAYSRYNHDSMVATINSLPDTSAYLAEVGGTNTIKISSLLGRLTDGGAINKLTEEEIAVATAKGWTITLT